MRYRHNARWLMAMAPFRALSISAAYLVPFFTAHNLSSTEFFVVQMVFSLTVVGWEIPSGYLADKFGRARCIRWSAPVAAASMIAYGLSTNFWEFLACEFVLGIANGLLSGADSSLLYDSMRAQGKTRDDFEVKTKHIKALEYVSSVVALPLAMWIVTAYGPGATLLADGLAALVCIPLAMQLHEAPIYVDDATPPKKPKTFREAWQDVRQLFAQPHIRRLLLLTVSLSTATYLGFWLATDTYEALGIPLWTFAVIYAGRQAWKALCSLYHPKRRIVGHMAAYVALCVAGLAGMASLSWVGLALVIGLDITQALQAPALTARINEYMPSHQRATLNSAINMVQRTAFGIGGVLIGILKDNVSLSAALLLLSITAGLSASYALGSLARSRTLATQEG